MGSFDSSRCNHIGTTDSCPISNSGHLKSKLHWWPFRSNQDIGEL